MHRLFSALLPFLLAACVSLPPPMSTETATSLKTEKTVVAFFDQWESIRYSESVYMVIATIYSGSISSYTGIWDIGKDLSGLHTTGLSSFGVRADSLYDVLAPTELADSLVEQKVMAIDFRERLGEREGARVFSSMDPAKVTESSLPRRFLDLLLAKGYKNLVWITHSSPFQVQIPSKISNVPCGFFFATSYFIFDLTSNRLSFAGRQVFGRNFETEGDSVKYFLEKDNLRALKQVAKEAISVAYKVSKTTDPPKVGLSLSQFLGLEARPSP